MAEFLHERRDFAQLVSIVAEGRGMGEGESAERQTSLNRQN